MLEKSFGAFVALMGAVLVIWALSMAGSPHDYGGAAWGFLAGLGLIATGSGFFVAETYRDRWWGRVLYHLADFLWVGLRGFIGLAVRIAFGVLR